jgi:Phage portal protein, lambda family
MPAETHPTPPPTTDADQHASRLEQRLWEASDDLWNSLVDARDAVWDDDGSRWLDLNLGGGLGAAHSGAASLAFSSEAEHREIRARCRALAANNEFAINGHENRISYVVGSGHTYRAVGRKGRQASAELVLQVQDVLEQFIDENAWHRRQQEIVRRRDRDGEAFLRFFVADDGTTRVRFVEPGQVTAPPEAAGDPAASFGIVTARDDVENVLAYTIDGVAVDAAQIQHRKSNVDANVKRGLPLFYPVQKNLRRAEKLLRNMSVVAEIQSAIALVRRHHGATRTAVQQFVAGSADVQTTRPDGGRTVSYKRYAPGTILDTGGGVEYDFPAQALDAGRYVTVLQAELRAVASRLVMPEFMLTSDASNANYASTLVAEGPAVKMFQRLQAEQIADDLQVMWRVVANAVRAGRLPHEVRSTVDIQVAAPALAVRDALQEAQVARIEFANGILSPQTWSQRRGLDYAQEQENIAAHARRTAAVH